MPRKPKPTPEKYCSRCGEKLERHRYGENLEDMTRFLSRKFCSLRCANSRGVNGQSSTQQHRISARFARKRCERCGSSDHLHVHHKNRNWRDHRIENLETLCIRCHLGKEHHKPKAKCVICGMDSRRNLMCQAHYQRWKKYGDALLTKVQSGGTYQLVRVPSSHRLRSR